MGVTDVFMAVNGFSPRNVGTFCQKVCFENRKCVIMRLQPGLCPGPRYKELLALSRHIAGLEEKKCG